MTSSPKISARWVMLGLISLINLALGSIYSWSVLSKAAAEAITTLTGEVLRSADLGLAFGIANLLGPLPMVLGGVINDRLGPKLTIMSGGVLVGLGLVACGWLMTFNGILIAYGLVFGAGLGLTYGATISAAIALFPDRRGLAGGVATAAYGMSSVVIPPIAQVLIEHVGIAQTFVTLGVVLGGVIVAGGALLRLETKATVLTNVADGSLTYREMLATSRFWLLLGLLFCAAMPAMGVISQAANLAQTVGEFSLSRASWLVSILALANMLSRLLSGVLSDKWGRVKVLSLALFLLLVGLGLLTQSRVSFALGLLCVGLAFGAFMGIFPGFTTDQFGAAHASVNYGVMFSGFALAGFVAPSLLLASQRAAWSWNAVVSLAALVVIIGAGLLYAFCQCTKEVNVRLRRKLS